MSHEKTKTNNLAMKHLLWTVKYTWIQTLQWNNHIYIGVRGNVSICQDLPTPGKVRWLIKTDKGRKKSISVGTETTSTQQ